MGIGDRGTSDSNNTRQAHQHRIAQCLFCDGCNHLPPGLPLIPGPSLIPRELWFGGEGKCECVGASDQGLNDRTPGPSCHYQSLQGLDSCGPIVPSRPSPSPSRARRPPPSLLPLYGGTAHMAAVKTLYVRHVVPGAERTTPPPVNGRNVSLCVVRRLDGLNAYRHGVSSLSTRYLRIGGEQGIYMEGGPGRGEGGSQREELELGERERTLSTLDVPPSDIYSSCTG